jgi:TPR repeat protein
MSRNVYFVRRDARVMGPYTARALKELAGAGEVLATDMVSQDEATWVAAGEVAGLGLGAEEGRRAFDVFISYSTFNKPEADATCSRLEAQGIKCWIAPRDITPGTEWTEAIIEGIEQSQVMVLIFSEHANASAQVRREVERAISKELPVVPFRVENVKPTRALEFCLGNTHWFDAYSPPLEEHIDRLAGIVRRLLGGEGEGSLEMPAHGTEVQVPLAERTVRGEAGMEGDAGSGGSAGAGVAGVKIPPLSRGGMKAALKGPGEREPIHRLWWMGALGGAALLMGLLLVVIVGAFIASHRPKGGGTATQGTVSARERQAAVDAAIEEGLTAEDNGNYSAAMKAFEKAAALGDGEAMCRLGLLAEEGLGGPRNYAVARDWYQKGTAAGDPYAPTCLGRMYVDGMGVDLDEKEALKYFKIATERGNASGMTELARLYRMGETTPHNPEEAAKLLEKAVALGSDSAMNSLGTMYVTGEGVAQDYAKAMELYQKGAAKGNPSAMMNVGVMFAKGDGRPRDYVEAMKWYQKAADAGNAVAMELIGDLYANGRGVPADRATAVKWYRQAVAGGNSHAAESLREVQ